MNSGRRIAEGGALLAVYCIILFITVNIPILSLITFFFLPVPFILVAIKEKFSWSIGFLFAALVLTPLIGTVMSLPATLLMGAAGVAIGLTLKRDKPLFVTFISTVFVFLGGFVLIYAISVLLFDVNYISAMSEQMEQSVEESMSIMDSIGQSSTEDMEKKLNDTLQTVNTLIPSLFVMASLIMSLLTLFAANPLLKKFSSKTLKWPHFRDLRLPKSLLWYYLITMLLTLFMNQDENGFVYMALTNLYFILQLFIMLQGYSLLFYISHVKQWPTAITVVLVVASLLVPLLTVIIRLLGIIDLGFPFRESLKKRK